VARKTACFINDMVVSLNSACLSGQKVILAVRRQVLAEHLIQMFIAEARPMPDQILPSRPKSYDRKVG
jgi:hypothetical protein